MKRDKLYRLKQLNRIIRKRKNIVKNAWGLNNFDGYERESLELKEPNRMNKWNLSCGCRSCRASKKFQKFEHKSKRLKDMSVINSLMDYKDEKEQKDKIKEAQKKAQELGHCLCHIKLKCLCDVYINTGECKCAEVV